MTLFTLENQVLLLPAQLDRDVLRDNWWDCLTSQQQNDLRRAAAVTFVFKNDARIDSAGLAWLLNAVRDATFHGIAISLQNVPTKLLKLAKISDVDIFLPVHQNL